MLKGLVSLYRNYPTFVHFSSKFYNIDTARNKGQRKGKNNKQKRPMGNQPKGKSESMYMGKRRPYTRISAQMKKLRDVPKSFFDNKELLLSKFKILGLEDEHNWTECKGEGIQYEQLLKLPFYNDADQLPENMIMKDKKPEYVEKAVNWDQYFEAIQKNHEVGFTSKYNRNYQRLEKPQLAPKNPNHEMYNDMNIEWDESKSQEQENEGMTPTKYKMQFKEISDGERVEIMNRIQKSNHLKAQSFVMGSLAPIQQNQEESKGGEDFFEDKDDNEFAICKESKILGVENNQENTDEIDYSKITKVEDIESNIQKINEQTKETNNDDAEIEEDDQIENEEVVISAEDLEKKQIESIQPKQEGESDTEVQKKTTLLNKESSPLFIPKINDTVPMQHLPQPPQPPQPVNVNQLESYIQAQNEIQTQQMIEQLNQEEIKKKIMQNPNAMFQYQQEMLYNEMNQNIKNFATEIESNPFELILRENPTSQWLYKDPQGFVRGPFTCFDMYTWHNEGYFNEDLELSLDGTNFFRLCDLRAVGQRNEEFQSPYEEDESQFNHMPGYGEVPSNYIPQGPQMYGYSQQQMPIPQHLSGHPAPMPNQMGYEMAMEHTPDFKQDYPNGYYSPMNPMGGAQLGYNPYAGHH